MHACIAAMSQAVPTIGLAYSRKFAGVFGTMSAGNLVVDLTQHDVEEVLRLVDHRFQQRRELKQRLQLTSPKHRESVLELFKDIGRNFVK
jgi:polysaccharide pyruvyl transferase WcaK-like protein